MQVLLYSSFQKSKLVATVRCFRSYSADVFVVSTCSGETAKVS